MATFQGRRRSSTAAVREKKGKVLLRGMENFGMDGDVRDGWQYVAGKYVSPCRSTHIVSLGVETREYQHRLKVKLASLTMAEMLCTMFENGE